MTDPMRLVRPLWAGGDKIRGLRDRTEIATSVEEAYVFANYRLVPDDRRLLRDGVPVPLAPKLFDLLLLLVKHHGRLVEKEEFLKVIWPGIFVAEVTLAHGVSELRKVLGSGTAGQALIETVPKRGYRFAAPVTIAHAPAEPMRAVVAVLPFENLSADPDREYVADGLTDELTAALGPIDPEHVGVIGRTSVMAYKRTTKSLADIGRELGATFVVESSLRREGERIRITSKLVRVADQTLVWSASYDSEPASLLGFQRELATTLAAQIKLRLAPGRLSALTRRQTHDAAAYDAYLRGRYYWNRFTPATTRRAVECYRHATELDPSYALAWAGLADALASSPIHADARPADVWQTAREAAKRAVDAEPDLAETLTSVGLLKFWLDWDWPAAEAALRAALQIDPSYSLAHRMLGILLGHMGERDEEARIAMHRARSLDPLQPMDHALSAQVAFVLRDFAAALEYARQATVILPDFWIGHYQMAQAYEQRGEREEALAALAQAATSGGGNSKVISLRGYLLAKSGREHEALLVGDTLSALARDRYVPPYATALVYAGLGRDGDVFEWLERALDAHDVHLALLPADPKWDQWRSDARFMSLLGRAGLPRPTTARG